MIRGNFRGWRSFGVPALLACSMLPLIGGCDRATYLVGELPGASSGGESTACSVDGDACSDDTACCGAVCLDGVCRTEPGRCRTSGEACSTAFDCCSRACVEGTCEPSCVVDAATCEANEECCSGRCEDGFCFALNSACSTSGNSCVASDECCSGLCVEGRCDATSSYCYQSGDACQQATDCCSGGCNFAVGENLGTCAAVPSGPAFCSGVAGTLCEDCNDCCSRSCIPFGSRGTFVCAQAEGCRQTGELCGGDAECCGGDPTSGLPGAGNVTCVKDDGAAYGVCRNAMQCSPQGNVCHIQDYACGVSSASNRCCGEGGSDGVCRLDAQGVPRCDGLAGRCLDDGLACALDTDCCSGACAADGTGKLICGAGAACLALDETCTGPSECCPGTVCARDGTAAFGVCVMSKADECSLMGQLCGGAFPGCCQGSTCSSAGRCELALEGTSE